MLSTGASGSGYHRLEGGPSGVVPQHTPASSANGASHPMAAGSTVRASSQALAPAASSTPFPIAPAPQHMMQPSPMMQYSQQPPPPPPSMHMAPQASQSQIVCTGCRTLLVYPNNATNVRCAVCSTITPVPPAGTEMAQLVCGGCRTLLMYVRGASSVQCSCCHTVNLSMETNQVAHINCGGCGMTLMYAYGAQSVKCAVCQFVTSVGVPATRMPLPMHRPSYSSPSQLSQTNQTVVVENPMTMDESGKLVSNVAVGLTEQKP